MTSQLGGSNSLRGGKKKYGPKTKCGNWVEVNKEPGQALPSGFPHAMYKTDAHQQMLEGVLIRPKRYGAALPPPEDPDIDYRAVINYDKHQGYSQWAGITSTEFVPPGDGREKGKEFASSFKMTGGITDPVELKEYRDAWTVEVDPARSIRFKTDAVHSANTGVPVQFRLDQTRTLPGTPKALERLRQKAFENGSMGIAKLRQTLQASDTSGTGSLRPCDLAQLLRSAGVALNDSDTSKVVQFFSRGGDRTLSIPDLIRSLRGPMSERRHRAVTDAFRELDESREGVVGIGELQRRLHANRQRRGISDDVGVDCNLQGDPGQAFLEHWPLYQEGEGVTRSGFEELLADVSCSINTDQDFEAMVANVLGKK